jgi:hypothetical protein
LFLPLVPNCPGAVSSERKESPETVEGFDRASMTAVEGEDAKAVMKEEGDIIRGDPIDPSDPSSIDSEDEEVSRDNREENGRRLSPSTTPLVIRKKRRRIICIMASRCRR